jgi:hypothetical protein
MIAFGAGNSCVNSLIPSMIAIVMMPMVTRATSVPPGPATSRISPVVLKIPLPMTALKTIN